ncbi:hypothetical protein [Amycolatopsis sp. NPDC059021]|uniref:hypothetical protein n=1 Tax=Amycolatopsis sp. NPDC059021 TaxID=3346704 RepID=UPI0036720333
MSLQPEAPVTTASPRRNRHDRLTLRPAGYVEPRYADLRDKRLAATLSAEDHAEANGMDPFERITCRVHRGWLHHCVSSPLHVVVVTGHRWCRACSRALTVAVDELAGDVALSCPRCGPAPLTRPTQQIVRACRASLAAAHDSAAPCR